MRAAHAHAPAPPRDAQSESPGRADGVGWRPLVLWTHQPPNFSTHNVVLNPAYALPQVTDAELLMVVDAASWDATLQMYGGNAGAASQDERWPARALVFTAAQAFADAEVIAKQQQQLQLSLSRKVAGVFQLANRSEVVLTRTPRALHTADHVELYFKDQYLSRPDMWRLTTALQDTCVYVGQRVHLSEGVRATVGRIYVGDRRVTSGYIAPRTKSIFRSESAKYSVFIQMSKEMWEFDESGEIYFEKVLFGFLPELIRKWDTIGTNHVISIILFTRVLYDPSELHLLEGVPVRCDEAGQPYVDYYKVVVDLESSADWAAVIRVLKEEFFRFQHDILLLNRTPAGARGAHTASSITEMGALRSREPVEHVLHGRLSSAYAGNLLEAINLALNAYDKSFIDRDLTRTGFELVVVTAGTGHFQVDRRLLRLTSQRMSEAGIALDLVCLTNMPLHSVPLFHFRAAPPGVLEQRARAASPRTPAADPLYVDEPCAPEEQHTYYSVPYWINCSFYNIEQDKPQRADRFVPRCRMYEVQMMEAMGNVDAHISLPFLELAGGWGGGAAGAAGALQRRAAREQFDTDTFRDLERAPRSAPPPRAPDADEERAARRASLRAPGETPRPSRPASLASARSGRPLPLEEVGKAPAQVAATAPQLAVSQSPRGSPTRQGAARRPFWRSLWSSLCPGGARAGLLDTGEARTAAQASALIARALASHATPPVLAPVGGEQMLPSAPISAPAEAREVEGHRVPEVHASPEEDARRRGHATAPVLQEKQALVNPSNPYGGARHHAWVLLRWQHLFPERRKQHLVKWWSLSSPACLPLTTLFLPSERELATQWQEYPHTISVFSDTTSFLLKRAPSTSAALAVLREMIAQRLSQGFQFVVGGAPRDARAVALRQPGELLRPGNFSDGMPIYLSTTNQVHRIAYSRQTGTIDVRRYVYRMEYDTSPLTYECRIWARYLPGYQHHATLFRYPDPLSYNWTYLDSLVAGYEERFTESLRFWRARFVLVPAETPPPPVTAVSGEPLSDEEVRLLGADKLAELFARAEARRPGERPERAGVVRFLPTTLDPSSSMHDPQFMAALTQLSDELGRRGAHREPRRVHREALARPLETLAAELAAARAELKVNDRLWHRVLYPDTFTGTDLVNWLCRAYDDVRTREDAVALGTRLQRDGFIEHVLHAHGFLDGHYFYRMTPRVPRAAERERDVASQPRTSSPPRRRVRMSRSMLIDVDPGRRSERAEVAVLHHDLSHNAENGFNFQIHWLGTTARLIDDLVQSWTRAVERYGLRLVEAPTGQVKDAPLHNPFQAPLPIPLARAPPPLESYAPFLEYARVSAQADALPEARDDTESWLFCNFLSHVPTQADQLFEFALLRHFGFVLDQEASSRYPSNVELVYSSRPSHMDHTQFVHRSGVSFVQVLGGRDGFLWLNNRLFTSHVHNVRHGPPGYSKAHASPPDPDHVRRRFQQMCGDAEALDQFYDKVWRSLEKLAPNDAPGQRAAEPAAPPGADARPLGERPA